MRQGTEIAAKNVIDFATVLSDEAMPTSVVRYILGNRKIVSAMSNNASLIGFTNHVLSHDGSLGIVAQVEMNRLHERTRNGVS